MIAIVDYGAGNLLSVTNAIRYLGYQPRITNQPDQILEAEAVILPGVGAAAGAMADLNRRGLSKAICRVIAEGRPFLGVCLGLQVLFTGTEEGGWYECLNVLPGRVRRLPPGLKIPHIGWNQVKQKQAHPVFEGIPDNTNFLFVHSYFARPEDSSLILAETEYGINFCSAVSHGNLVATQFHPEKSGPPGLRFYHNFLKLAGVRG